MWTWINGDISDQPAYGGDFDKALGAIKAKAVVMPSATDQYFPPMDNEAEVDRMPDATLEVLPSILGHFAPFSPDSQKDIDGGIRAAMREV